MESHMTEKSTPFLFVLYVISETIIEALSRWCGKTSSLDEVSEIVANSLELLMLGRDLDHFDFGLKEYPEINK